MIITTRVSNELADEIDRVAAANGQTRSAWMANVLLRAAVSDESQAVPVLPVQGRGHPDDYIRVTVRLHRSEIEGIDKAGAPLGLSRNAWIKRALRWQLWDKAGSLRLATISQDELKKLRKQVMAIGRNINQAVHAMNAANQPESSLDVARIAAPFLETCAELKTLLFGMRRELTSYAGAEVSYWTSAATAVDE
jgi:hypothetical protein